MTIVKTTVDGTDYFTTTARGVEYCASFSRTVGQWFVATRRLSLGRRNMGGGKYVADIAQCKPFAALPALLAADCSGVTQ